jgi:hypothetical protein
LKLNRAASAANRLSLLTVDAVHGLSAQGEPDGDGEGDCAQHREIVVLPVLGGRAFGSVEE